MKPMSVLQKAQNLFSKLYITVLTFQSTHSVIPLTLKAPITTAPDDIHKYVFIVFRKKRLDVSSESSARQRIHMKNQALFSSKNNVKKLKCRLLQCC